MVKVKLPSNTRLRLISGVLRIHDLERNLIHEIYPFERANLDSDGISPLAKKFLPILGKQGAFKLFKTLKALDTNGRNDWSATYSFLSTGYSTN